jgi:hypothetical protein
VLTTGPDGNYASYVAGHLGVPQTDYRTRHLVIAYDYLTRRPLSADEQRQAIAVNADYLNPWQDQQAKQKSAPPSGLAQWIDARNTVGSIDADFPNSQFTTYLADPDGAYGNFNNCLDDAFRTATLTLKSRATSYGPKDPAVLDWVRGQDAVFSNCGDGKPGPYYGPPPAPPPPPAPHPPTAAPSNAPLWLKQDRTYQLAAAQFYKMDFDAAIADFRTIAADNTSPWAPTARYLVARTLVRKATLAGGSEPTEGTPAELAAKTKAAQATATRNLTLAQHELLAMQADPHMASMQHGIVNLLDYVNLRLQPDQQATVLSQRLRGPATSRFGQALIDLTWLRTNTSDASLPPPVGTPAPGNDDLLDWIDDLTAIDTTPQIFSGTPSPHTSADVSNASADILKHWRASHTTVWLVAALTAAHPTDASTPELLRAAAAIPTSDPGYTAVTYHRLRLQPRNATTRTELLAILPRLEKIENTSTINLFTTLTAATAPTLNDWLASIARKPANESSFIEQGEDLVPLPGDTEDVCGKKIPANSTQLFDVDASLTLNRRMPLRLLAEAAESNTLPENLRFQVAQAAFTRALLLDADGTNTAYQAIARRMEPVLTGCRATWKPVLDAYNAAATPTARHAAALLALMRFASTEPSVRLGEERRNAFATYDVYRQNWWCRTVPTPGGTIDEYSDMNADPKLGPQIEASNPPPPFLTPADLAEAHTQVAALEKIPSASTYFAQQALTWAKLHPKDPATPDILGEADRVLRNSCRTDPPFDEKTGQVANRPNDMTLTPNLAKALFTVLHRDYPNSPWAKRYKSWQ